MNRTSVFTKTAKGLMEATGKTSALSRDMRALLKEVDGKATMAELQAKLGKVPEAKLQEALQVLVKSDYIREFSQSSPDAAPPQKPAPQKPAAQKPAEGEMDLDFTMAIPTIPAMKAEEEARQKAKAAAEAAARAKAEAEARARAAAAEAAARARAEAEAKAKAAAAAAARAKAEADAKARSQAEARARAEAEAKAKAEAEARAKRGPEEQARRDTPKGAAAEHEPLEAFLEARERQEFEEAARRDGGSGKEAEERARAQEQARIEAEARARKEAEEKARREAEEKTRREAEEKARKDAEARSKAEAQARIEAEARARKEAEERARVEAELKARLEEERKAKEQAERERKEAEEKARREADELRARLEEERKAREEAERRAKEEAERQRKEAEEKARREADELRARIEAERKAREEAERKAKEEAERQRQEAEEKARREADELRAKLEEERKAREEAERKAKEETERRAREDAERKAQEQAERERRESEEKARREAEEKARREAEERARANEQARIEAEARVRREAEEAERRERAEAERKAREQAERERREADEQARREADERTRAEAQARGDAEARARREAEEAAARDAEEQRRREEAAAMAAREAAGRPDVPAKSGTSLDDLVRIETDFDAVQAAPAQEKPAAARLAAGEDDMMLRAVEDKARQEAEEKARADAEERARKEAEEEAQRTEDERRRAEEEAHSPERAPGKAGEQAPGLGLGLGRAEQQVLLDEQDAETERHFAEMEEELEAEGVVATGGKQPPKPDERAREREEEEAREHARAVAEAEAHDAEIAAEQAVAVSRAPIKWGKPAAVALFLMMVVGLVSVHFVAFDGYIPQFEKLIGAHLQQPVKIKSVHLSLVPQPHWRLDGVSVGNEGQFTVTKVIAVSQLGSMFSDKKVFTSIELDSPVLDEEGMRALLFGKPAGQDFKVASVIVKNGKLNSKTVVLPAMDAKIAVGDDGAWRQIALETPDHKTSLLLKPEGEGATLEVETNAFSLPFDPSFILENFNAKGNLRRGGLKLSELKGGIYGGFLSGSANIAWGADFSLEGEISVRAMDPGRFAPALFDEGKLEGKATYAMRAKSYDELFAAPRLEGTFEVRKGALLGVDLTRLLQGGTVGGKTPFTELTGTFRREAGKAQLRQVELVAGPVSAGGTVDADAGKHLSGRFAVELKSPVAQAHANLTLSGTLKEPRFSR